MTEEPGPEPLISPLIMTDIGLLAPASPLALATQRRVLSFPHFCVLLVIVPPTTSLAVPIHTSPAVHFSFFSLSKLALQLSQKIMLGSPSAVV